MNTNTPHFLPPRRGDRLTQAEVFDEMCVFNEIGFAAKDVDDDFADAGCNLFTGPTSRDSIGKIRFMTHNPAGEVANGLNLLRKFGAQLHGQFRTHKAGQNSHACKNEKWKQGSKCGKAFKSKQHGKQTRKDRSANPQCFQPCRSFKSRRFFDSQFQRDLLQEGAPLLPWYQGSQLGGRRYILPFPSAMPQKRFSQEVERPLRETGVGSGTRYFALNEINQLSRREEFCRLSIVDADVKSIFDCHYDFDGVQSHVASFGSGGGERQGRVS